MTLPTFLVIGAMKSGTTALHTYLAQHPQVFVSERKELDFFVEEFRWSLGLEWYSRQFEPGAHLPVRGEASPSYTMGTALRGVPERIAATLPDARLVYVVREPLARTRANYLHAVARGLERRPVDVALQADFRYVDASRYAMQVGLYLPHVRPEQLLLITAERLRSEPGPTLDRVLEHLGLPAGWRPAAELDAHRTSDKRVLRPWAHRLRVEQRAPERLRPVVTRLARRPFRAGEGDWTPQTEEWLLDQLRPDVEQLRPWLGEALDDWGAVSRP